MRKQKPVYIASGSLQAEMVVAFLQSKGVEAFLSQESVGAAFGLQSGFLGKAKVYVRDEDRQKALGLLAEMDAGAYMVSDNVDLTTLLDEQERRELADDVGEMVDEEED